MLAESAISHLYIPQLRKIRKSCGKGLITKEHAYSKLKPALHFSTLAINFLTIV